MFKSTKLSLHKVTALLHIAGIHLGFVYALYALSIWQILVSMIIAIIVFSGVGFEITYHRLLIHRSYETGTFWKTLGLVLGSIAYPLPILGAIAQHRWHHKHSDTDQDVTGPTAYDTLSLLKLYFNPFTRQMPSNFNESDLIKDYKEDKLVHWFNRYSTAFSYLVAVVLLLIDIDIFLMFWAIPAAVGYFNGYGLGTIYVHVPGAGVQDFNTKDNSQNLNGVLSRVFMLSARFHNTHHRYPQAYILGDNDIPGLLIHYVMKK